MSSCYCLFCEIIAGRERSKQYYRDADVVVIEDKFAAADYHFLAIPTKHIRDCTKLTEEHIYLLKQLKAAGDKVLNDQVVRDSRFITTLFPSLSGPTTWPGVPPIQAIFGFHVPPHNSQNHLHMHIVAPADKLTEKSRERVLGIKFNRLIPYNEQLKKLKLSRTRANRRY